MSVRIIRKLVQKVISVGGAHINRFIISVDGRIPVSEPFFMNEGAHMNHAGNLIASIYVDLRESNNRSPITALIKGCKKQHAIELSKKIHLSKPVVFRNFGECLIDDVAESKHTSTQIYKKTTKPEDIENQRLITEERAVALNLLGYNIKPRQNPPQTTQKTTESLTSGKSGWIFCASIAPINQTDKDKWQISMDSRYDHISYIDRPREFARALGSMTAKQVGPQGKETESTHKFGNEIKFYTKHKIQVIYHGPVIYVDNPYEAVFNASTESEFALLSEFVKRTKYKNQREYRFLIHSEKEPKELTIDLDVSLAMLESMKTDSSSSALQVMPTPISSQRDLNQQEIETEHNDEPNTTTAFGPSRLAELRNKTAFDSAIINMANNPTTPITVCRCGIENLSTNLHAEATIQSALNALRCSILGPFETSRVKGRRYVEASSSAWHSEPCIRRLCSIFEDPIKHISITNDNFIMIHLKFSDESPWHGKIVIGPQGTCRYTIKNHQGGTTSYPNNAWSMSDQIVKDLRKTDMRTRQD